MPAEKTVYSCSSAGSGPAKFTPSTGRSSGICCTAISASPRATNSAMRPLPPSTILPRIASAIPSRVRRVSKYKPLVPSRERTTDRAASSAFLKASTLAMSGIGRASAYRNPEAGAADVDAALARNFALLCQCVDHRARDDRHVERNAVFDLALECIGGVVVDHEPRSARARE